MKIISINLNQERNEVINEIKIKPLSDMHIGDKLSNLKEIKKVLEEIKNESNTYTILNGDMCNTAIKSSKSDVYSEELTPMQQIIQLHELLEPIKDKIFVIASGNHEDRIQRETDIDIIRIAARELGIEDRYADGMWYLFLQFGQEQGRKTRVSPVMYQITGYHGSGNGRKSGGKINRLEEMHEVTTADLYIMSHTHKPIITKGVIFIPDEQHKTLIKKEQYYLMTNSFLEYGGYAEKLGLPPSNTGNTEAILSGKVKKIKLSM